MTISISASQLPQCIQKLLEDRQRHVYAIAGIDELLAGVGAALGNGALPSPNARKVAAAPAATQAPAIKGKKRRRGRGQFALSAEESILTFVNLKKNPITTAIKQHLAAEGRSNSSITNTLGKLVKEKKLKRTPLGGHLGSHYTLA